MSKRVTVTLDRVSSTFAAINELVSKQVLVGIPESAEEREGDTDGPMNNATLGYIHEFGSPKANIPARPFLIPGVRDSEAKELAYMKKAAEAAMRGDTKKADAYLNDAGIIGMNGARREITYGSFVPLQPETVAARHRSRGTKSMRESERRYLELVSKGMSPGDAQTAAGIQPLINTAQLRNSITYVVRKK